MSYYYRGNLAVELEKSRTVTKTKRTIRIKPSIPTKEKLLYLLLISLIVAGVGLVGVRYSQISQYNYEIQRLKKEIKETKEQNAALLLQVEQLSNSDRILREAQKMGMVYNPEAVHLIGQPKGKSARQGSPQTSPANGPMPNDQNAKTKQPAPPKTNS
ncbi:MULTISPECIES: cell division protein FtsL [Brevibacillus]|jgi:cell division protein FtsL|uniref:Cell division protein FtsL n=1 Tax=Brevibacillus thermoruber TaxID=33942 RepID=A0A9X3TQR3_9BACL|nr:MULTISPECIES: cell division protein FtsL [Brevibacillus]MDA5108762.1 cell division protein FtsL [Brevibacillus thermoruber]TRY23811.1 cell division protein FtsL [Brevibacillus sp. LEMMJ03]UYZ14898.1 cell division protein FtsL [Brevibacillus sp. WF146]